MTAQERRTGRQVQAAGTKVHETDPTVPPGGAAVVAPCRADDGHWCEVCAALYGGELAYEAAPDCTRCELRGCCTCTAVLP